MVSRMRALKRAGLVVAVLVVAGGAYALWYVYGAWPVPDGYEFPRHSQWGGGPTALFEGELVDEDGCIRGSDGATVVWPPGYSLHLHDGRPEVHGGGQVVGMGVSVRMGGGWYDQWEASIFSGAATRCAPPYFLSTGLIN